MVSSRARVVLRRAMWQADLRLCFCPPASFSDVIAAHAFRSQFCVLRGPRVSNCLVALTSCRAPCQCGVSKRCFGRGAQRLATRVWERVLEGSFPGACRYGVSRLCVHRCWTRLLINRQPRIRVWWCLLGFSRSAYYADWFKQGAGIDWGSALTYISEKALRQVSN